MAQLATLRSAVVRDVVTVEVSVDGAGPLRFLLDTGFHSDVIDVEAARQVGLDLLDVGVEVRGQGPSAVRALFAPDVQLSVDPEVSWSGQLMALPLGDVGGALGTEVDGILGSPVFDRYVVEIDYQTGDVRLWEPFGFVPPSGAVAVPIALVGSRPHADVLLGRTTGGPLAATLLIDTGANLGVALSASFSAWRPSEWGELPPSAQGLGGATQFVGSSTADVDLGSVRLREVDVAFSADALERGTGTPTDGLLGGRAFRGRILLFDYSRKRIYLTGPLS